MGRVAWRRGVVGLVASWLLVGTALIAYAARTKGARVVEPQPKRPDIVALFSSGTIVFDANGTIGSTSLKSGRVSLSTDDAYCVAKPTAPCRYTINTLQLAANDFTIKGTSVESVEAFNPLRRSSASSPSAAWCRAQSA